LGGVYRHSFFGALVRKRRRNLCRSRAGAFAGAGSNGARTGNSGHRYLGLGHCGRRVFGRAPYGYFQQQNAEKAAAGGAGPRPVKNSLSGGAVHLFAASITPLPSECGTAALTGKSEYGKQSLQNFFAGTAIFSAGISICSGGPAKCHYFQIKFTF